MDGHGGWAEVHGLVEEGRGRRGWTSPGEERSNETGKVVIAHGSVEFCEVTPFLWPSRRAEGILVDARRTEICVAPVEDASREFPPNEQRGGVGWGGLRCQTFSVVLFSFFSADHERD